MSDWILLKELISSLRDDMNERFDGIENQASQIRVLLVGNGQPGLIRDLTEVKTKVASLENWKRDKEENKRTLPRWAFGAFLTLSGPLTAILIKLLWN